MTKASIIASALELPPAERLEIVEEIWDSLADVPLSDTLQEELALRLADHLQNPTDVIPWEEVRRGILGQ